MRLIYVGNLLLWVEGSTFNSNKHVWSFYAILTFSLDTELKMNTSSIVSRIEFPVFQLNVFPLFTFAFNITPRVSDPSHPLIFGNKSLLAANTGQWIAMGERTFEPGTMHFIEPA